MGKFELYRLEQPMPLEAPAGLPPGWGFLFCGWWVLARGFDQSRAPVSYDCFRRKQKVLVRLLYCGPVTEKF